ncbi:MAG: NAD+ synthase [Nitrososphaerota archaeon]|uniref:NAD+ synthase n=1 Tax=Candidatus Bathycorpusculum sp. TaxID=2994959 RepID=UPI00281CD61F|nr:NAD+ synthase [Candidatus Termiticorpusculum sp.]MCL2257221.1 NAD+ synthase [Candidatus Termiticorpusculum sp.]MCL2292329.1 NAD+ synthase [Candidatus Termiticorpusculum sp.]MDR0461273.1 NAD+ synthase [Nitrososphaerota archaeon]
MKLTPSVLNLDFSEIEIEITNFIKKYVSNSQTKGVVLGLSGGIDSATTAALCSKALGSQNVLALVLPEGETRNQKDINDAETIAKQFNIETQIIDMSQTLESIYTTIPIYDQKNQTCKGNIKARMRMIILYYYANKLNKIVCGSSDKSETLMGYFTKWGDGAADFSPIKNLYKTQVRKLAIKLGIPESIATKPATPALWPNQLAESELGIKYESLDLILYGLEKLMPTNEIANQLDVEENTIETIKKRLLHNKHKRRLPITFKIDNNRAVENCVKRSIQNC